MAERINVRRVADILGVSIRTVQGMAIRGEIPSAARIRKTWTFRETAVRDWIATLEQETAERAKAAKAHHDRWRDRGVSAAYERAIWPKGRDNPVYHRRRKRQ